MSSRRARRFASGAARVCVDVSLEGGGRRTGGDYSPCCTSAADLSVEEGWIVVPRVSSCNRNRRADEVSIEGIVKLRLTALSEAAWRVDDGHESNILGVGELNIRQLDSAAAEPCPFNVNLTVPEQDSFGFNVTIQLP